MTGPEHYRAAEQMLENVEREQEADNPWLAFTLAAAQVHATLALAAAAANAATMQGADETASAWTQVTR